MGVIVVGYVPKAEGHAALRLAAEEAKLRGSSLVVVNSHRGGREFDREDALESESRLEDVRSELKAAGVEHVVHSGVSVYFRDPDGARIELIADPLGEMYGTAVL